MTDCDRQRTVGVVDDAGSAVADRVSVDGVRHEEEVRHRVHRQRPEGAHRRSGVESDRVGAVSVQLRSLIVDVGHDVRRFVGVVAPQPALGRRRSFDDSQPGIGDLELWIVDCTDLEVVEVVVEGVESQLPTVGLGAGAVRECFVQILLSGGQPVCERRSVVGRQRYIGRGPVLGDSDR